MDEDISNKPMVLTSAVCELSSLQRNNNLAGPSSAIIGSRSVRGFRSIPPPTMGTDGIYTFGHQAAKLHVNLNPRYISKITNSPRKITDTSLRMRPYFIPERSRTKSENNVEPGPGTAVDFFNTANNNSNSNMMETCDGYSPMDPMHTAAISSTSGHAGNSFTGAFGASYNGHSGLTIQAARQIPTRTATAPVLIKKSRSLEDVRVENIDGSQPSHEMEFVSSRIQKLKVQE